VRGLGCNALAYSTCVTNEKIDSSFQCCIKDGSRSAAYAIQLEYANHLKVLCSKSMVLNVQAKGSVRHYQVSVKKLNANEPLMTCRKRKLVGKTVGFFALTGQTVTGKLFTGYRPTGIKMAEALHRLLYET